MRKPVLLFFKQHKLTSRFITNDIELLSDNYTVKVHDTKTTKGAKIIFGLISQLFFLSLHILRLRLVYIWFADYHSFFPVLLAVVFRKKSVICAGGYECTYIPEINCGVYTKESFAKRMRRFCVSFSLKHCSLILPVDETLISNINKYIYSDSDSKPPLNDGIQVFIPGIKTQIETIYLGYDNSYFTPGDIVKENSLCSAGLIVNDDEFRRKGFDLLVKAAEKLPDVNFILVGLNDYYIKYIKDLDLSNIETFGIVNYDKLVEIYRRSKIFAQISMFEGMPSTICEAMLCGCIPIGSNVNGIPRIINDTGVVIFKKDFNEVIGAINTALNSNNFSGEKARNRIVNNFTLNTRKTKLLVALDTLLNQ